MKSLWKLASVGVLALGMAACSGDSDADDAADSTAVDTSATMMDTTAAEDTMLIETVDTAIVTSDTTVKEGKPIVKKKASEKSSMESNVEEKDVIQATPRRTEQQDSVKATRRR